MLVCYVKAAVCTEVTCGKCVALSQSHTNNNSCRELWTVSLKITQVLASYITQKFVFYPYYSGDNWSNLKQIQANLGLHIHPFHNLKKNVRFCSVFAMNPLHEVLSADFSLYKKRVGWQRPILGQTALLYHSQLWLSCGPPHFLTVIHAWFNPPSKGSVGICPQNFTTDCTFEGM